LYKDSQLKTLHEQYKDCVAEKILNAFKEDRVVNGEVCVEEKRSFYNYLHENKRIEHDNLVAYFQKVNDPNGC